MAAPKRSRKIENALIRGLARGGLLTALCREIGINRSSVYLWMEKDAAFAARYLRARREGFDALAEECLEIADNDRRDWRLIKDATGTVVDIKVEAEQVSRSKLRIDTRFKLLSKWDPQRYGDRLDHKHSGALSLEQAVAASLEPPAE